MTMIDAAACDMSIRWKWLASQALSPLREHEGDDVPDTALVEQARQGDMRALPEIYHRHAAAVYRRLTHLIGSDSEREDLMQEVFTDLFRQIGSYRGEASLRTYLFRIVANKAYDHLRQRNRRQRDTACQGPGIYFDRLQEVEEPHSFAPTPEDLVRNRQELALVSQALDKLTPKKRIAFLLRTVEELSLKEIADQVGATVFTVAQRIRHADRELHLFIEEARQDRP